MQLVRRRGGRHEQDHQAWRGDSSLRAKELCRPLARDHSKTVAHASLKPLGRLQRLSRKALRRRFDPIPIRCPSGSKSRLTPNASEFGPTGNGYRNTADFDLARQTSAMSTCLSWVMPTRASQAGVRRHSRTLAHAKLDSGGPPRPIADPYASPLCSSAIWSSPREPATRLPPPPLTICFYSSYCASPCSARNLKETAATNASLKTR